MTKRFWSRALAASLALGATTMLAACEDDDLDLVENDAEVYTVALTPLNGSGVTGTATFTVTDDQFAASVEAAGLAPGMVHPQHIHAGSACPTASADANADGFVDVTEGTPAYGGILVPLDSDLSAQMTGDFPTLAASSSTLDYDELASLAAMLDNLRAADPDPDDPIVKLQSGAALAPATRTVVLHGIAGTVDLPESVATIGDTPRNVTLPVACGTIVAAD